VGVCISKTIWFIDTNILAPWILEKGNILDLICSHYGLSAEFKEVYANRYVAPDAPEASCITGRYFNPVRKILFNY
jgi:hypothetical protein